MPSQRGGSKATPSQRGGSKATPSQRGGGSIGQSIKWVDPSAPEQSAAAGGDLLKQQGNIIRPAIGGGTRKNKRRGGFYPSVMAGVVDNALLVAPMAAFAGRKLLSRKTRKGGGKKGNVWRVQQAEAKAALGAYGKPTAKNIAQYAAAKRKGSLQAEEVLDQFRKVMQEKREAIEAVKVARAAKRNAAKASRKAKKNAEKNAKAAAREEAKASRKAIKNAEKQAKAAERASKKAIKNAEKQAKAATKKNKGPKKVNVVYENNNTNSNTNSNNNERPLSALQLKRMAEANAAAAKKAMKKTVSTGQTAWKNLMEQAKVRLATEGKATLKDAMQLAKLMKEGKNTASFINEFRTRAATAKPQATVVKPEATVVKPKVVREHSEDQKKYYKTLSDARTFLGTVGAPLPSNMSQYASMVLKGENTTAWLEKFKERRPAKTTTVKTNKSKTVKTQTVKTVKPKTVKTQTVKANKPKTVRTTKPLSVVKEETERNTNTENSMQGYSEDFEPEPNKNEN